MSKVSILVEADFDKKVLQSSEPVMVDFGADWCRPCKTLKPIIDSISEEIPHKVFYMDVDECSDAIVGTYKIKSVPTIIVFKDGKVHKSFVGVGNKQTLLNLFQ